MNTLEVIMAVIAIGIIAASFIQLMVLIRIKEAVDEAAQLAKKLSEELTPTFQHIIKTLDTAKLFLEQTSKIVETTTPLIEEISTSINAFNPILEKTQLILSDVHETTIIAKETASSIRQETVACMAAITTTTRELTTLTRQEAEQVCLLVDDVTGKIKLQVERLDQLSSRTTSRIDNTAALIQRDLLGPIKEISAILAASKSFLEVLFATKRKQINQAYQDEEMFI